MSSCAQVRRWQDYKKFGSVNQDPIFKGNSVPNPEMCVSVPEKTHLLHQSARLLYQNSSTSAIGSVYGATQIVALQRGLSSGWSTQATDAVSDLLLRRRRLAMCCCRGYPGGIFDPFGFSKGDFKQAQTKEIKNGALSDHAP